MPPPASATRVRSGRWRSGSRTHSDDARDARDARWLSAAPPPDPLRPRQPAMTHEPTETLTPAEARAREAVRSLSRPQADSAFRARLKREFEAGSITSPYARRGRRSSEQAPSRESGMGRLVRGRWSRWAPLVWAAAAAFLITSGI